MVVIFNPCERVLSHLALLVKCVKTKAEISLGGLVDHFGDALTSNLQISQQLLDELALGLVII